MAARRCPVSSLGESTVARLLPNCCAKPFTATSSTTLALSPTSIRSGGLACAPFCVLRVAYPFSTL
ncbi:hypothetical protein PMIN01_08458 [Paraphaeosphaeria minitans]|uniref:Uncharacterized protein n=1 Tax=Paraphaeosphaeria minitans TaxID=565426 RepID=A0A9P6GFL9_9PLEO|nr:hypothetical protein PMIN01_08458 [Paraphaeosphaeria minitans]